MSLRKVSFFFPVTTNDKQLVRSFAVGTTTVRGKSIVEIDEKMEENGDIYFDVYHNDTSTSITNKKIWKSYTPKFSDIEREFDV